MASRFNGLDNELLNLKDVILKNLQVENKLLRKKVNVLERKILTLESDHNVLDQYGQHNNIKITEIPKIISNQNIEEKVVDILNEISVDISPKVIKTCSLVAASKTSSKKTIVLFTNGKHAKKALINKKKLRNNSSRNCNVFINENVTVKNNEIACNDHVNKIYTKDRVVHISSPEIDRENILKIYHVNDLFSLFLCCDFGENYRENAQNDSLQSSY